VHVTRFVTLSARHDSPRDAVRRARGHCFALCAFDVADYTGGTPSCSCGYARMARCPFPFESHRRKCNFNDSDGIASSHAAAGDVTKMRADSSNSAQLTWRFHSRRPDAVLDANLRALRPTIVSRRELREGRDRERERERESRPNGISERALRPRKDQSNNFLLPSESCVQREAI